nr:MAG TPA: Mind bomb SH3 repeat domain [Caudoviricetes sp.]
MAKYKCGDKVWIVSKRPQKNWNPEMDKYLGKAMTIIKSGINGNGVYYYMEEDLDDFLGHWFWYEDMIAGLAEPAREPYTVELRFDGMITTATLKRGGRDVKTAEARCNPKDTYSRAEGARVAVERLFEKKRKEDKPKESKPKIGDKFVIVGKSLNHGFDIGETVTLIRIAPRCNRYENRCGLGQWVYDSDVNPCKEKSK